MPARSPRLLALAALLSSGLALAQVPNRAAPTASATSRSRW